MDYADSPSLASDTIVIPADGPPQPEDAEPSTEVLLAHLSEVEHEMQARGLLEKAAGGDWTERHTIRPDEDRAPEWRKERGFDRHSKLVGGMRKLEDAEATHTSPAVSPRRHHIASPRAQVMTLAQDRQAPPPAQAASSFVKVVDVEPVMLGATTYLVDKVNGVAYSNLVGANGEPVEVGRWVPNVADRSKFGNISFGAGQYYSDAPGRPAPQQTAGAPAVAAEPAKKARSKKSKGSKVTGAMGGWQRTGSGYQQSPEGAPPDDGANPVSLEFLAREDMHEWPGWAGKSAIAGEQLEARRAAAEADAEAAKRREAEAAEQAALDRMMVHDKTKPRGWSKLRAGTRAATALGAGPRAAAAQTDEPPAPGRHLVMGGQLSTNQRLKMLNGPKHTGDSHTPGVTQSRTQPPADRHWPAMMDDRAVARQRRVEHKLAAAAARRRAAAAEPVQTDQEWQVIPHHETCSTTIQPPYSSTKG